MTYHDRRDLYTDGEDKLLRPPYGGGSNKGCSGCALWCIIGLIFLAIVAIVGDAKAEEPNTKTPREWAEQVEVPDPYYDHQVERRGWDDRTPAWWDTSTMGVFDYEAGRIKCLREGGRNCDRWYERHNPSRSERREEATCRWNPRYTEEVCRIYDRHYNHRMQSLPYQLPRSVLRNLSSCDLDGLSRRHKTDCENVQYVGRQRERYRRAHEEGGFLGIPGVEIRDHHRRRRTICVGDC